VETQPNLAAEKQMNRAIATVLRGGVALAAVVVLVGGMLFLLANGGTRPHLGTFAGEPSHLTSTTAIVHAACSLRPRAVIQLGLLLLIAVPIARVVLSAVAFARQRDYIYVGITLIVLGALLVNLLS
jgi:uncharacterized membrane protein